MSEIERLARSFELPLIDDLGDPFPGEREAVVRAILQAMREPTESQYDALSNSGVMWRDLNSAIVWTTYIDALLNEGDA